MKIVSLLGLMLMSVSFGLAGEKTDEAAVRETIQYYLDGFSQGDVAKLKKAFRQDVVIKYLNPWANGAYSELSMAQLNEFMGNLPERWEVTSTIDSVDVHGTAAGAKVTARVAGSVTWTDYLQLLKIEDKWWIIGKISHGDLPKRKK